MAFALASFVPSSFSPRPSLAKPQYNFNPPITTQLSNSLVNVVASGGASATAAGGVGFLQLAMVFCMGGFFFSTLLASIAASRTVGQRNLRRAWQLITYFTQSVLLVFVGGVGQARRELRKDGQWRWKPAWETLREQSFSATRQAAAEGVGAMRRQAKMYSAAVGKPGLLLVQYVVNNLLAYNLTTQLKQSLKESLSNIQNSNIRKLKLVSFETGSVPPDLTAACVYNLGGTCMAFDIDMDWDSEIKAKMQLMTKRLSVSIPIEMENFSFSGMLRVQLTPLIPENPGYGAILLSLAEIPQLNLSLRVGGAQITKVPWLKQELLESLSEAMSEQLLWPKRIVIPATRPNGKPFLSQSQLDELKVSDPLKEEEENMAKELPTFGEGLSEQLFPKKDRDLQLDLIDENQDGIPDIYQTENVKL